MTLHLLPLDALHHHLPQLETIKDSRLVCSTWVGPAAPSDIRSMVVSTCLALSPSLGGVVCTWKDHIVLSKA